MQITVRLLHLLSMALFAMNQRGGNRVLLNYEQGALSDTNSLSVDEQQVFESISTQHLGITSGSISYQITERDLTGAGSEELAELDQHEQLAKHFLGDTPVYREKSVVIDKPHESRRLLTDVEFDRREEKITSTYLFSEKDPKFMIVSTSEVEGQPTLYYALIMNNDQETTITSHIINNKVYDAVTTLDAEAIQQRSAARVSKHIDPNSTEVNKYANPKPESLEDKKPARTSQHNRNTAARLEEPYMENGIAYYNHYVGFSAAAAAEVGGAASLNLFAISFHNLIESTLELQAGKPVFKFKLIGTKIYDAAAAKIGGAFDAFSFAKSLQNTIPGAHITSMMIGDSETHSGYQAGVAGVGGTYHHAVSSVPNFLVWLHEIGHEFGAEHRLAFCNAAWCTDMSYVSPVPIFSQPGKILYGNVIGDAEHDNLQIILMHIFWRVNNGEFIATVAPVVNPTLTPTAKRTPSPTIKGATNPPTYSQKPALSAGQSVTLSLNPDDNLRNLRLQFNNKIVEFIPVTNEITFPGRKVHLEGGGIIIKDTNGNIITDTRQYSIFSIGLSNFILAFKRNVNLKLIIENLDNTIKVSWYNGDGVKEQIFELKKQRGNSAPYIADPVTVTSNTQYLNFDSVTGVGATQPTQRPVAPLPTHKPTVRLTSAPSNKPTAPKTSKPSTKPSFAPTNTPSRMPTQSSAAPTTQPSARPSKPNTQNPSKQRTSTSFAPTNTPSRMPTQSSATPTTQRSDRPSNPNTQRPSKQPIRTSFAPTNTPSRMPTQPVPKATRAPTSKPASTAPTSRSPTTAIKTAAPTDAPTNLPSSNQTDNREQSNDNAGVIAGAVVAGASSLGLAAYLKHLRDKKVKKTPIKKDDTKVVVYPGCDVESQSKQPAPLVGAHKDEAGDGVSRLKVSEIIKQYETAREAKPKIVENPVDKRKQDFTQSDSTGDSKVSVSEMRKKFQKPPPPPGPSGKKNGA